MPKISSLTLLAIMSISAISGCSTDSNQASDYGIRYKQIRHNDIEANLAEEDFRCANAQDCRENVGLVMFNEKPAGQSNMVGECTGFLIHDKSGDIVATNSHCIPDYLKSGVETCPKNLAIRFMKSPNSPATIFSCKQIVSFTNLSRKDAEADAAFFRIAPTGRKPLEPYKNGIREKELLQVVKITPKIQTLQSGIQIAYSELLSESCQVRMGTFLRPKSVSAWSSTLLAYGCQSVSGNSGSPVFNESGQVVGILQSHYGPETLESLKTFLQDIAAHIPETIPPHMNFTNLSCVNDPVNGISHPEKCEQADKLSASDCLPDLTEQAYQDFVNVVKNWKSSLPKFFVYQFTFSEDAGIFAAQPTCVKPRTKSKQDIKAKFRSQMKPGTRAILNRYYQPIRFTFIETESEYTDLELKRQGGEWVGSNLTLPECSKLELFTEEITKTIGEPRPNAKSEPKLLCENRD